MPVDERTAAMVALLRSGGRAWAAYVLKARQAGGPSAVDPRIALEEALGLLAYEATEKATAELEGWAQRGIDVLTLTDSAYPQNLAVTAARPPLLFVAGDLRDQDARSVAVIGTREPTGEGRRLAQEISRELASARYTVVSGMATGIDAAAHEATLAAGARTVAIIGTGLDHVYPAQHAALQAQVTRQGAVISQFWPESEPTKQSFPARNAVMAGFTLASVIVEASPMSGTRIQARHALDQGRLVILMRSVMANDWAGELAARPGVHIAESAADVVAIMGR